MTHDVRGSASSSGAHVDAGSEQARGAKGPDELRREIERTRHELGDTVEELAGKMDVKARARARADEFKDRAARWACRCAAPQRTPATSASSTVRS